MTITRWVEKQHGPDGPRFIAEQIGRLVLNGDEAGVDRWKQIAGCYDALLQASTGEQPT